MGWSALVNGGLGAGRVNSTRVLRVRLLCLGVQATEGICFEYVGYMDLFRYNGRYLCSMMISITCIAKRKQKWTK